MSGISKLVPFCVSNSDTSPHQIGSRPKLQRRCNLLGKGRRSVSFGHVFEPSITTVPFFVHTTLCIRRGLPTIALCALCLACAMCVNTCWLLGAGSGGSVPSGLRAPYVFD